MSAESSVPHASNVVALPLGPVQWTKERVDLIKRTICPKGITDDEFALFIEQCKRSGLDPLLKECFCVARRQNAGNRERPNWVTKYEFQPAESGMLARAERFPDFKGIQASAVFGEDEIIVDQGKGEVVHRFNPAKRKGSLVGAWSRVVRDGKLPVVVWLDFAGYVQQSPLWAKIPTTMMEKCARVAALRKAYPEAFGGLYVREEMPQDEFPTGEDRAEGGAQGEGNSSRSTARASGGDQQGRRKGGDAPREWFAGLNRKLLEAGHSPDMKDVVAFYRTALKTETPWGKWSAEQRAQAEQAVQKYVQEHGKAAAGAAQPERPADSQPEPVKATFPPLVPPANDASAASDEGATAPEGGAEEQPQEAVEEQPAPRGQSVVVAFGPYKGKTASELSDDELTDTIDLAHEKLMEQPKARWAKAMRENLAALEVETELRCRMPSAR